MIINGKLLRVFGVIIVVVVPGGFTLNVATKLVEGQGVSDGVREQLLYLIIL